jgi:[ribosomal protein S5]-alanine N-acetyltransferase
MPGPIARVVLNRASRADRTELVRGNQASRAYHQPWAEPFADEAGFDAWLARSLTGPHVQLVSREAASGEVVGVVNINEIVGGFFQSAYLGYYGMVRHAGRGLMMESVGRAITFAFADLGLHRLEANIQPENNRSLALIRRLGFRREGYSPRYLCIGGVWRDHERWALLADEWDDSDWMTVHPAPASS